LSVGHDGQCSQSADCAIHQYCHMGICTNFKEIGEACYHKNECGRTATCFFKDPDSISGICTEYMKIENGDVNNKVIQYISDYVCNSKSFIHSV